MKRFLLGAVVAGLWAGTALAQSLLPNGQQQFSDANGVPLASGSVYFYEPGTTTPKTTWQNQAATAANTNPVVLNSAGRATIWGSGNYRQIVQDQFGTLIWDQITASAFPTPATVLQIQTGTNNTAPITPLGLAGAMVGVQTAGAGSPSGYQKFPNGTIIQWGRLTTATGAGDTITLPIPFPNAYTLALDTGTGGAGTPQTAANANTLSLSQFKVWTYSWTVGTGTGVGTGGWGTPAVASFVTTATQYAPFSGGGGTSAAGAESLVQQGAPATTQISGMYLNMNGAFGAAETATVTLRVAGADSTLTCTTAAADTVCHDTTHTVNITQGQLVDWKIVAAGGGVTNATPQITIGYTTGSTIVPGAWAAAAVGLGWVAIGY